MATLPGFSNPLRWPLYQRVILGVALGALLGAHFGQGEIAFGWTNAHFGIVAGMYIQLLTALATPLIFFAIADAFVQTNIAARDGVKMFAICAVNVAVAFVIGLTILNVCQPGRSWQGKLAERASQLAPAAASGTKAGPETLLEGARGVSLSPLAIARSYVPTSIAQPFTENMVLTVAVFAILVGAALRTLQRAPNADVVAAVETFGRFITAAFHIVMQILFWLIELAPYAICMAVAGVVGATGATVFRLVGVFFVTVMAALGLHGLLYYPLSAWLIGGRSPRTFFREGASAIVTGFSINSSLATAPLTLDALQRMRVSESSARLSACVGTNFNNDGITLYEAITALFITQAAGMDMSPATQVAVLLAALTGSMGIAGIPNSGLIILTLVLRAARLPDDLVQLALPLVYSIDFINARVRSAVNVMGDMQVAILLDAGKRPRRRSRFGEEPDLDEEAREVRD